MKVLEAQKPVKIGRNVIEMLMQGKHLHHLRQSLPETGIFAGPLLRSLADEEAIPPHKGALR